MSIVQLTVENFMRIKAVHIKPDGSLVRIEGRNGQGKSSILKAIEATIGGAKGEPDDPIHHGAEEAKVTIQTEDYIIEKLFRKDKPSRLRITSVDGEMDYSKRSPQKRLDGFFGKIAWEPLEFIGMPPKERNELFVEVIGLDLVDLDARIEAGEAKRKKAKEDKKAAEIKASDFGTPEEGLPEAEVSIADLLDQRTKAYRSYNVNESRIEKIAALSDAVRILAEKKAEIVEQLAEHNRKLAEANAIVVLKYDDIEELSKQIGNAEETNKKVRSAQTRAVFVDDAKRYEDTVKQHTTLIEKLRSDRRLAIEAADIAGILPGLGYGDEGLLYDGVPLEQASQSEQLIVSAAIGLKLKPGGITLIRQGSLLDPDRRKTLCKFVEKEGGSIWFEIVTSGEAGEGFVIEDGTVLHEPVTV